MMSARARLAALPLLAVLVVIIAVGAAARSRATGSSAINQQSAEVAVSVGLTLLGLLVVALALYLVWCMLHARRNEGPPLEGVPPASLRYQLLVGSIALAVIAGTVMLVLLLHGATRHPPTGGGAAAAANLHLKPSKPLPYSVVAGAWTAGAVVFVAVAAALAMWLRRRGWRGDAAPFVDFVPEELASPWGDLDLRAALAGVEVPDPRAEPDPRRAVIAAWLAMTDAIGRAWRAREACEAPQEYLQDALAGAGVRPGAAGRLTSLFEAARWSGHPVGEDMRRAAVTALDAVRAELGVAS